MRLRTLPLSLAGSLLGVLLALADYQISGPVIFFILLTTICLQILSNLSNELGDFLKGTDTQERLGPQYELAQGNLTVQEMKRMIRIFVLLSAVSGLAMIYSSFGTFFSLDSFLLMLLGASAIASGMKYTLGKNPYGYMGLGDLFVFIYFGIVSVLGSYFVAAHTLPNVWLTLPAISIGLFSIAVLNINNIRDMKTDIKNRKTVAIMLGATKAKIYETLLIVFGWIAMIAYCLVRISDPWHYLFVLTLPLYILALKWIWTREDKALDPVLPLLVISTFLLSLLTGLGFTMYLFFL